MFSSDHSPDFSAAQTELSSSTIGEKEFAHTNIAAALVSIQADLSQFSQSPSAIALLEDIFHLTNASTVATILEDWQNNIYSTIPKIRVLEETVLSGAKGAYAIQTNEIYLADSLLEADDLTGIKAIILEEYGHSLDAEWNGFTDTPGDEGELFALTINGIEIADADWLRLKTENDFATMVVDGQTIAIEQSLSPDFNHDNIPDILWRQAATGLNATWLMGGTHNAEAQGIQALPALDSSWDIKGVADFNQDGNLDILWRQATSGLNAIWLLDQNYTVQSIPPLQSLDSSWDIKGVADFNQDGVSDILWRQANSGLNAIWLLNQNYTVQSIPLLQSLDSSWDIKGVTDFNQDGVSDILWRQATSGLNAIWLLNQNYTVQSIPLLQSLDSSWDIKGVADFNQDGVADILWRQAATGINAFWLLGGSQNTDIQSIPLLPSLNSSWDIKGVAGGNPLSPDLTISTPSVPTSATLGDSITLSAYVKNTGNATANSSTLRYWLSDDDVLNTSSDINLGYDPVSSLGINGSTYESISVNTANWGTGTKYIFFQVDGYGVVPESNEANNVAYKTILIQNSPSIQITSPNGGNTLTTGNTYTINWTDNLSENIKLDLYKGSTFVRTIASSDPSDGSFSWTVPTNLAAGSNYKVKITSTTNSSIYDYSDSYFTINPLPSLQLTSPNGGNTLTAGNAYNISWTDNLSENIRLGLYKGAALVSTIDASEPSDGSFSWTLPSNLASGSDYRIKISSTTNSSIVDWSDNYFTIAQPDNGFNIEFDYRFDTNGWFTSTRKAALEAAADIWEAIIQDEFANIAIGTQLSVRNPQTNTVTTLTADKVIDDLVIFVGARDLGGPLGKGGPSGYWYVGSDLDTRYNGSDFEPWTGSVAFDPNKTWYYDANPLPGDTIPSGSNDFVSVAVHEIGHVLGIGTSDAFDNWVSYANGNYYFTGSATKAKNGNSSLLLEPDQSHIKDGYQYNGSGEAALDPTLMVGTRKLPNVLDIALLDDIGYEVDYTKTNEGVISLDVESPRFTIYDNGHPQRVGIDSQVYFYHQLGGDIINDAVSLSDREDIFRFDVVDGGVNIFAELTNLTGDVALHLAKDFNNNKILDTEDIFISSDEAGSAGEYLQRSLAGGTYFAYIEGKGSATNYTLSLDFTGDASNERGADSTSLGYLSNVADTGDYQYSELISQGNDDYFRFRLDESRHFSFAIREFSGDVSVKIVDENGELIVEAKNTGLPAEKLGGAQLVDNALYYMVVTSTNREATHYKLVLNPGHTSTPDITFQPIDDYAEYLGRLYGNDSSGVITQDADSHNNPIDSVAGLGANLYALAGGEVIEARNGINYGVNGYTYSNWVNNGTVAIFNKQLNKSFIYWHLKEDSIDESMEGTIVATGALLGQEGRTGYVYGSGPDPSSPYWGVHTHVEVHDGRVNIDMALGQAPSNSGRLYIPSALGDGSW